MENAILLQLNRHQIPTGYNETMGKQDQTIEYYDMNASSFTADTINVDLSTIQDAFLSYLVEGSKILDLGCGTGRDSKYFLSKGFMPTPCDGSAEMCRIAEKNTGIKARQLLFEDLDHIDEFDGIWACSCLLHVPSSSLRDIFSLVHQALKENGVLYFSFKYGDFEGIRKGRYFTDLTETTMDKYIDKLFAPLQIWVTNDARPGRNEEKWLNVIARKITAP